MKMGKLQVSQPQNRPSCIGYIMEPKLKPDLNERAHGQLIWWVDPLADDNSSAVC